MDKLEVSKKITDEIERVLRNLKDSLQLNKSEWIKSCLVKKRKKEEPDLTHYQALQRVFQDILNFLREESPYYADILYKQYWEERRPTEIAQKISKSPSRFYDERKIAIQRFALLLLEKEETCKQTNQPELGTILPANLFDIQAISQKISPSKNFQWIRIYRWVIVLVILIVIAVFGVPSVQTLITSQEQVCDEIIRDDKSSEKSEDRFARNQGVSIYNRENTNGGILNNSVRSLTIDERGLWIGYFDFDTQQQPVNGLGFFNDIYWFDCDHSKATAGNINAVAIDHDNQVWVATEKDGVAMFDGRQWHRFTLEDGLPSDWGYGLTIDDKNDVWVSTWAGVAVFDGNTWSVPYSLNNKKLVHNEVHAVAFDSAGNTWIGYINGREEEEIIAGVTQIKSDGTVSHYKSGPNSIGSNYIRSIKVRQATDNTPESVWFATADKGVSKFENGVWTVYTVEDGLPSNSAQDIAFDKYNRVWVATIGDDTHPGGVAYFNDKEWITYDTLPTHDIAFGPPNCSDCPFDDDHIWTGTADFGLTHSRVPYPDRAIDVIEVCFISDQYGRVCPPLSSTKIKGIEIVTATYPHPVDPNEKLHFEVIVSPQWGYEFISDKKQGRGDYLSNIDNLFGAYKIITAPGTFLPGDRVTLTDPTNPLIAPQLITGEEEKTFTSRWRVWMHGRYAGPAIHLNFTVRNPEASTDER